MIILHNCIDPHDPQKRTYKQIQESINHTYKVGDLVEIKETGVRLFVASLNRDCDATPLYSLSPYKDAAEVETYYGQKKLLLISKRTIQ